jgi:hypothetical protein
MKGVFTLYATRFARLRHKLVSPAHLAPAVEEAKFLESMESRSTPTATCTWPFAITSSLDEDDHVAIVVPLAQISLHEIHVMFKRSGAANFRDFTDEEIASFSRAEFIVTRLYEKLNIGSFNVVFLLDRFQRGIGRPRSKFGAIATFITREVDLAVSELSMAYVVDKLPEHTCNEARHYLGEMNLRLAARS